MPKLSLVPQPRAVLYHRRSSTNEESISIENQETAGRDYCARMGYTIVGVESDPGVHGRTWSKRPGVQRAVQMIKDGQADVIVLWKWSRLSRSRKDWAVAVDMVDVAGGRIEASTETVDVTTSTGRFARGVFAEFAAFEAERIGETWKEAQARRVRLGLPPSGVPRWGYTYSKEDGYTPDPLTGPILAECYRRYISGESYTQIMSYLKSCGVPTSARKNASTNWTTTQVSQLLRSPFAAGYITYHGETSRGAHQPLISDETWEDYQVAVQQRSHTRAPSKVQHEYRGLLICVHPGCGQRLYLNSAKQQSIAFTCAGATASKVHRGGSIQKNIIDEAVTQWLESEVADEVNARSKTQSAPRPAATLDASRLNRLMSDTADNLDKLTMRYLQEIIPQATYERLRDELQANRANYERQLQALRSRERSASRPQKIDPDILKIWPTLSPEHRSKLLMSMVARIEITSGRPQGKAEVISKWDARANP